MKPSIQTTDCAVAESRGGMAWLPNCGELLNQGFTLVRELLPHSAVEKLAQTLGTAAGAGQRGMLSKPEVSELAASEAFLSVVRPCLPGTPRPVRAIYFDKSPGRNWLVAWHQDLTIAVTHEAEAPGFGPWSRKDGLIHVQPPVEILENMLTLRLHLDDADESNGALRLIAGSHAFGRLSPAASDQLRTTLPEVTCRAGRGDALLMRPLTLHASGRSVSDRRRRILHLEYAGLDLPCGLNWHPGA